MDKDDLINGYFSGSLSENQSEELERLLETDSRFAADFKFERELQSALKKEQRQQIKTMFSQLDVETSLDYQDRIDTASGKVVEMTSAREASDGITTKADTEPSLSSGKLGPEAIEMRKPETKVFSIRPWLVAASVMLMLGLGVWFLMFNDPDLNNDQLYAANFTPYENVVHPIERGAQLEDLKTEAFTAYENREYPLALELFKELQTQQADPYIAFYEAIVLMQLNEHQDAVPLLEGYIEKDGQLKDRATWYLALAHLKLADTEKSIAELEKLAGQDGFKSKAAAELLSDLK